MGFRISVAGAVGIEVGEARFGEDLGPRARLAFAYLVAERHRPVSRDELAEVLWGEKLPATWEPSLRGVMSRVRTVLSNAGLPPAETLTAASGCYLLQLPSDAVVDVEEAQQLVEASGNALKRGDAAAAAGAAAQAVAIAAGGFLPGDRGWWVERRQAELAELRVRALEVLATALIAKNDYPAAVAAAQQSVDLVPLRETSHLLLITAHATAGNRAEALRAYERCRRILAEELGVSPSAGTEAAYLALLREDVPPPAPTRPDEQVPRQTELLFPPALDRRDRMTFVGRHAESMQLRHAWKRAAAGEQLIALIAGEAGMGKTRLAAEVARVAHHEGGLVLYGRCDEEAAPPYQPFAQVLSTYLASVPPDEVRETLGPVAAELAALAPGLLTLIAGAPNPRSGDPDTERWRLFEAVTNALTAISMIRPCIVVLDDLHWAPKPTLLLLRHLASAPQRGRLLVLGTYRHTDIAPDHPIHAVLAALRRDSGIERLTLNGLDVDEVAALLQGSVSLPEDRQAELASLVHAETGGNPFFAGEVIHHLSETGALATLDQRRRQPLVLGVPEGTREVVTARLSRLSEQDREVLTLAAVKGGDFDFDLLVGASGLSEDAVLDALEAAEQAHLVVTHGNGQFGFAHALVRKALEDALPATRRRRLHRRVAHALAVRAGPKPGPLLGELALHYWHAAPLGEALTAAIYCRRAGDDAAAHWAYEEACLHYRRALEALDMLDQPDPTTRCDVEIALGDALHRAGSPDHRPVLFAAAASARALRDPGRLARAALALNLSSYETEAGWVDEQFVALLEEAVAAVGQRDTALRARLLAVLASELTWAGDAQRRSGLSRQAVALARQTGDPHTLATVLAAHHWATATPANLPERLAVSAELIALGEALDDPQASFRGHWYGYWDSIEAGNAEHAAADLEAAEGLSRRLGQPVCRWDVVRARASQAFLSGRLAEAEDLIKAAAQLGWEAGVTQSLVLAVFATQLFSLRATQGRLGELKHQLAVLADPSRPWLGVGLAWACCQAGDHEQARLVFDEAAARGFEDLPEDVGWLPCLNMLGTVGAELGDVVRAPMLYQRLAPFSGRVVWSNAFQMGPVDLTLGRLAAATGHVASAESHFAAAARTSEQLGAPCYLAAAWADWAELLARSGDPETVVRARRLAQQALLLAEPRGMAEVATRARAVLSP